MGTLLLVLLYVQGTYTFARGNWYEITSVQGDLFLNFQNVSACMNVVATAIGV